MAMRRSNYATTRRGSTRARNRTWRRQYSLVDTVGGAAVISQSGTVSPTVDMRIDYLAPATADLRTEAEVIRTAGASQSSMQKCRHRWPSHRERSRDVLN